MVENGEENKKESRPRLGDGEIDPSFLFLFLGKE